MVATILRLRWRILVHQFTRDWWRLLFVAAGGIWSISVVPTLFIASASLSKLTFEIKQDSLVGVAALIGFGWIVVPLLATGVDDALDPARFAPLGLEAKRIMPGLAIASFTTVPALFFVGVAAVMAATWRGETNPGWVIAVACIGAAFTVVSWVFAARLAALWAVRLLATRGGKAVVGALAASVVALVALAVSTVRSQGIEAVLESEVAVVLRQLARTPLGAGMAAPSSIVLDNVEGAAWRLGMMAAWVVVLYFAWRAAVAHVLVNPVSRGAGAIRSRDAILAAASRKGRLMAKLPPVSVAVLARTARSWRTDPRYITQVIGAVVLPLAMGGLAVAFAGDVGLWVAVLPLALAITIGWGRHNDLAYDASGVWLDIVSGVRGRDVLLGRLIAVTWWAAPALVGASALAVWAGDAWWALPAVASAAVGALGAALGVAAVTSVAMPYRVPAPGESPFGADAGSIGASLAGQVVSSVGTGVVMPFILAPLVCALLWGGAWWAVAAVWAIAVGAVCAWAGTLVGGRLYDAKAGRLIGAVS